ncbi:DUF4738 domain-containing protein [Phocaeicola paurosaccharolyticus]|jgi:PBP1b-binding outer membrane lipoprotein LpoB|uniref:DUF4738 domain-containing protein n=1 Tax=Phocaeicola paurosaccharolyticus TaxID=732242 RepID=UPI00046805E5|nr:DUF4738 domain-containing protein [Phocaeicola paurosaccharolyticus]
MKNFFLLIASAALICGCSGKKSEEKNIDQLMFQLDSTATDSGIQKMQASNSEQQINVNGKSYNLSVNRAPSDSLPKVKTETGLFCDNKIAVRIINKSNNSIIFSKTFTKRTFEEYLSDDFKNNAILEGIVFDSEKSKSNKTITLAASISFPLSDLYIPFSIKIANGTISSISKDDNFDDLPQE